MISNIGAFKLKNGSIIPFERVDQSTFSKLPLSTTSLIRNETLSKYEIEAWLTANNQVISYSQEAYMKFQTLQDVLEVCNDFELNAGKGMEPLAGLNVHGENFPAFTKAIIQETATQLDLSSQDTSNNLAHLIHLSDSYLKKEGNDYVLWTNFLYFIALVGEAAIAATPTTKWVMSIGKDHETWNPELYNGVAACDIVLTVYQFTFENEYSTTKLSECLSAVLSKLTKPNFL